MYEFFFSLVRSGLWQQPLDMQEEDVDWIQLIELAHSHTVLGQIADAANRSSYSKKKCVEMTLMGQFVNQARNQNEKHAAVLIKIIDTLEEKGIKSVLLKGLGLAAFYQNPFIRQCGDIDIYVDKNDYAQACELLDTMRETGKKRKFSEKHFAVFVDGVEIELHYIAEQLCNPFINKNFQIWSRECLAHSDETIVINKRAIRIPNLRFNIVYTFCHLWDHFEISGIGLRQLSDLAALIHANADRINRKELQYDLSRFGLLKQWQLTGAFLVKHLGLPKEEFPCYKSIPEKKLTGFTKIIMNGGNFGKVIKKRYFQKASNKFTLIKAINHGMFYIRQFFSILPYSGTGILWRAANKIGL